MKCQLCVPAFRGDQRATMIDLDAIGTITNRGYCHTYRLGSVIAMVNCAGATAVQDFDSPF